MLRRWELKLRALLSYPGIFPVSRRRERAFFKAFPLYAPSVQKGGRAEARPPFCYSFSMVQRSGNPACWARPATCATRNSAISFGYTPHTPMPF
mgnify:CR=1 FL=1